VPGPGGFQYVHYVRISCRPVQHAPCFGGIGNQYGRIAIAAFQKQLFQANQNFSVYVLQAALKERKIYTGSPNGMATARTISAIRRACDALQGAAKCKGKILSEGVIAQLIVN
jgi:hypothetical protein